MSGEPLIPPGSRAVLIGVPRYQDARYRSYPAVGNSVEGMYQLLVESGLCGWREEQVEKIINPVHAGQLMGRLRDLARGTTGVLLLYFVGHGQPSEHTGELCLAIADTDHANPDSTGLEYAKVKRLLHSGTPAATRIAILDCCYSGRAIGLGSDDGATQLAELSDCTGAYTLTAADERAETPPDDEGHPRTAFTGELLGLLTHDGIPGGPAGLTLGVIFPHLRHRLAAKALPRPNQRSDDSAAAFVLARNAANWVPVADARREDIPQPTPSRPVRPEQGRRVAGTRPPTGPRARRRILTVVLTTAVVLAAATGWVIWPLVEGLLGVALPGLTPAGQMTAPTGVDTTVFSHDGHTLATAGVDGTVRLWDTISRRRVGPSIGPITINQTYYANPHQGMAFSADDRTLTTVGCGASASGEECVTARRWDTSSGQQTRTPIVTVTGSWAWVLSPDGRALATGATIWDLDSGQKTDWKAGYGLDAAAVSPDGHTTAFAGAGEVAVTDTPSGHTIASFVVASSGGTGTIRSLALSPDNRTLAVALDDNTVHLWDIASGRQTGSTLTGLAKPATAVVFSHDGHALAAAGGDDTALVWETSSHRRFGDPLTGVNAIAFSPDDQTFATGGLDHTIRLWTLPPS